jgi:type IV secretion system protein VirB10
MIEGVIIKAEGRESSMNKIHLGRRVIMATSLAACLIHGDLRSQDISSSEGKLPISVGTRVPLVLMNSVNTRNARVGDHLYFQTIFPVTIGNQIVIPRGTDVRGSIVEMKRPGRVRGRGGMLIRFDQMILPNGVTRSLSGAVIALDGRLGARIENEEGRIRNQSSVGSNTAAVATAGATGGALGAFLGNELDTTGAGVAVGIGVATIAAIALVLMTRGPDIHLARGTIMEMVVLSPLAFGADEVKFRESDLNRNPLRDIPEIPSPSLPSRRFSISTLPFMPN